MAYTWTQNQVPRLPGEAAAVVPLRSQQDKMTPCFPWMPCLLTVSQKFDVTKLRAHTAQSQDNGTTSFWSVGPTRSIVVSSEQTFGENESSFGGGYLAC